MFGIPIITLLGYAITYGPKVVQFLSALAPVIKAAEPVIAGLIKNGMPEAEAQTKVFGWLAAPHKMTQDEVNVWMEHSGIGSQS